MSRRSSLALACLSPAVLVALATRAPAQNLPEGFIRERIASFDDAIALAFIDEHRLLVAEHSGRVWFVDHGVKRNVVYDARGETLAHGDRGLMGIAVAPDFDLEGWVYLLLVARLPEDPPWGPTFSRLVRVRAELRAGGDLVALPETRQVLLGETWPKGIPGCEQQHTLGNMHFLSDGSLVLASGDNAGGFDIGGEHPDCFLPGRTPPDQDLGALRAQLVGSLAGKLLRLDS
jgi:glucose/arabinose dehydrogenase